MEDIVLDIFQASVVAQALIETHPTEEVNDILSRLERHIQGLRPIKISLNDREIEIVISALESFRDHDRGFAVDETLKSIDHNSTTHGKTTA